MLVVDETCLSPSLRSVDAEKMSEMSGSKRLSSSFLKEDRLRKWVRVYDRRFEGQGSKDEQLETTGLDYNDFLQRLQQIFNINLHDAFVLTTTDRKVLDFDKFDALENGSTLHLLKNENQALSVATEQQIDFTPHYDTLIRGGMYEYHTSRGQNSLPYAIAELIDNALSATVNNKELRTIEIRMHFTENLRKPALIVLDNGCGMTCKQLNDWAVYRLSKFSRESSSFSSEQQGYVRPDPVARSLNSDISHFGVGGKQAIFYIGDTVRMITKPASSPDVHELVLSKEDFERKAKNKDDVYKAAITNRKPCSSSHVSKNQGFLHSLIAEESGKESFTAVVITGVLPEHVTFLREDFEMWTRQLAHIYHYYIHGIDGNTVRSSATNSDDFHKIDIQITLQVKSNRLPCVINLRDVDDDMETLFLNTAEDTFEFKVFVEQNGGVVEGVIRYHPFLYDRETYPKDPSEAEASGDHDDDDIESEVQHQARGKRPIFDCYWNGRLIPNTTVSEFDWCAWSKDSKIPAECYNRISGVLFSDDALKVTTNKLTFMDLEMKLKSKHAMFMRFVKGQKQRGDIKKEFTQWLESCHDRLDKQIKFSGYKRTIEREEGPNKKRLCSWGVFSTIEWNGKKYTTGQLVKSKKTQPIHYGAINEFLLRGDYSRDVFATGGLVELTLEPKALYNMTKAIPISKIDQIATIETIEKHINEDLTKLPDHIEASWPDQNPCKQNDVLSAGTVLGPLQVEIRNKRQESLSRMPTTGQGNVKKLIVVLKIIHHGVKGDEEVITQIAQHTTKHAYWFKKIERLTNLGKYTLFLSSAINEANATVSGDLTLPTYRLNFTIKEGDAQSFIIGDFSPNIHVGAPFNIPLLIKDGFGNPTRPPPDLKPLVECSGLSLHFEKTACSGTTFTIKNVQAKGKVQQSMPPLELKLTLPGMKKDTQTTNIILLPGEPHSLHVKPEDNPVIIDNGSCARFDLEIQDESGNITTNSRAPLIVHSKVEGFPVEVTDYSRTGAGEYKTKDINLKIIKGEPRELKVTFKMPNQKNVALVLKELKVLPSTRVSSIEVYSKDENLVLRDKERIQWLAGGTLENLHYRLYDEACTEVPLTADVASKIQVSWTGAVNLEEVCKGKLPDVQVPTQVQDGHFCQVSYQDQSVSVSFHIVPRPDEPKRLKVSLPQTTVKLGEIISKHISLELVDQYGNPTKTLDSKCVNLMSIDAEGLEKSTVNFEWQEKNRCVLVSGVRFRSGTPGSREMCFTYRSYVEKVIVKVAAGVPAQLKLIRKPEQPLQVLNDHSITTPFIIQLCDEWGNPSVDQRVVVELKSSPQTLKVETSVTSQPVNAEGIALFSVRRVSGPKGYYQLDFKGLFNGKPIPGPSVNLTVIPDPNKPVSLSVEYDNKAKFPAGGKFPVFSLTVLSDDGSPMTNFNPAAASMWLWQGTPEAQTPPPTATELKCSKPMENEKNDCLHFRDKEIPEHVGQYTIQFSLGRNETKALFSSQITINVVANEPVKLVPDSQLPTPVVSYSTAINSRTLLTNVTLSIVDLCGNPAGQDLNGKVKVSIKSRTGDGHKNLPLFEDKTSTIQFNLVDGKVRIPRLAVMQNSPGEDGMSYILLFEPQVLMMSTPLSPFELPFHFYNDGENQQKMAELTKKKDKLTSSLAFYEDTFSTYNELLAMLHTQLHDANMKETEQRNNLRSKSVEIVPSITDIDRLLKRKKAEAEQIQKMPRRVFSVLDRFKGLQDVLGMVGHLALVEDDDAARVISWHIRGDMNCVITRTTEAARRIYDDTQRRQEVMALDSIYVPPNDRPLPHIRNGRPLFNPTGNPVYVRDLLIYPQDRESCKTVFKNILGETILIDDLDSGNCYRRAVVQSKTPCPTILTRQGDRISSRGKFGGTQNKAPPMSSLQVFGAPYPQQYHTLMEQIDLLTQYRSAVQKRDAVQKDFESHQQKSQSADWLNKQQEMEAIKQQLDQINRQISAGRPVKRGAQDAGETSGITAKRTRESFR